MLSCSTYLTVFLFIQLCKISINKIKASGAEGRGPNAITDTSNIVTRVGEGSEHDRPHTHAARWAQGAKVRKTLKAEFDTFRHFYMHAITKIAILIRSSCTYIRTGLGVAALFL